MLLHLIDCQCIMRVCFYGKAKTEKSNNFYARNKKNPLWKDALTALLSRGESGAYSVFAVR